MNKQQIILMIWVQHQEEILSQTFQNETNEMRKMQKDLPHYFAMKEFDRLGQLKATKLSEKDCDQECIFCNPEIVLDPKSDFKN